MNVFKTLKLFIKKFESLTLYIFNCVLNFEEVNFSIANHTHLSKRSRLSLSTYKINLKYAEITIRTFIKYFSLIIVVVKAQISLFISKIWTKRIAIFTKCSESWMFFSFLSICFSVHDIEYLEMTYQII